MSEILDVLSLPPALTPYFLVNTAVPSVDILMPVPPPSPIMINAIEHSYFQAGDNLQILSAGFVLPENFTMASPNPLSPKQVPCLQFLIENPSGVFITVSELAYKGVLLPIENYESGAGVFIPVIPYAGSLHYRTMALLSLSASYYPQVSMQNVPAGLNGTTQLVTVFFKVLHSLQMSLT